MALANNETYEAACVHLKQQYDGTAREALAQIDSRQYAIPYQKDGRRIVKVGINFDSSTRTIGDWIIEVDDSEDHS